jgi:mannonate dehydratase
MNTPYDTNRRQFLGAAAAGAAAFSAARSSQPAGAATPGAQPPRPSRIRIGTRINPKWMESKNDADLRFLTQIGVDCVDIELVMVKGYTETGCITGDALRELIHRFDAVGLKIERANALGPYILNAHLGRPDGQKEIDNLKRIGEALAEAAIPVYGIQACQASYHLAKGASRPGEPDASVRAGWSRRTRRGGYDYPAFDLAAAQAAAPQPAYRVTAEQLWKGLINIYRQVVPVVEGSKTRIAMHGNDPPLYEHLGNPQIICRFADFDRLFAEVPSTHSGITFCVGTRYESGEDVFEGIRHFGRAGKLMHVHFRNVRGTLPANRGYSEVFVDDGDLNMAKVLRALDEVGYDGVIDYDHVLGITGDAPLPKQYIAFAVGYMRGLLHSIG